MKLTRKFFVKQVLPSAVFFGGAFLLAQSSWLKRMDDLTFDVLTRERTHFQPGADPQFQLVAIDDPSVAQYGRWPWSRYVHGEFLAALVPAKPAVVTWDILFTERSTDDEDQDLSDGAAALPGRVIFAAFTDQPDPGKSGPDKITPAANTPDPGAPVKDLTEPITRIEGEVTDIPSWLTANRPLARFRSVGYTGFADTPAGPDGVREEPMLERVDGKVFPSLSLQTMLRYWSLSPAEVRVVLGDAIYLEGAKIRRRIPIDSRGNYRINYRFGQDGSNGLSFAKLATAFVKKLPNPPDLAGKILLVGEVATGLTDNGPTPFAAETPLVLVHANIIDNILKEDYVKLVPVLPVWLLGCVLGVAGLAVYSEKKARVQATFALGVPLVYVLAVAGAWMGRSWLFPLLGPVLGFAGLQVFMIVRRMLAEQKAKQEIKGMFGTYVSPALVSKMIDSGTPPQLGGHDAEITAYFSDIQSFSTFSEKLGSGPLVELMNEYLTACTDIVQGEGGTLDKYIGDAVVAMFGAPIPLSDHAFRSCVASQLVHLKLGELRAKWKNEGEKWPQIVWNMQTRIGLNSGVCMIGNMGSRTRFNYTMMGDNVNLAARMESGSKAYGAYTMVAEATKLACEKHGGDRLVFRFLDKIVVKGRSIPVPIYEIVGLKENVTDQTRDCLGVFAEGIARYLVQDWDGAEALFRKSSEIEPNIPGKTPGVENNPSLTLIKRCDYWRAHPPAADWTGVYEMKEK